MSRGLLLAALLLCACAGRTVRSGTPSDGIEPTTEADRIARGAELFAARGCAACHSIGAGVRVGPDLAGLVDRRDADWIVAMITRPDSMLRHDPVARDLAREHGTAMPRLGIGADDAVALVAYIGSGEVAPAEGGGQGHCPCPGCGGRRARRGMAGG